MIKWLKNTYSFYKELQKLPQRLGASPQTPVCGTFELHYFTHTHLPICTFYFKSVRYGKFLVRCSTDKTRLQIFQSTISLSPKKFVSLSKTSDDIITCHLWFRPPPPNQKSWLRCFLSSICSVTL